MWRSIKKQLKLDAAAPRDTTGTGTTGTGTPAAGKEPGVSAEPPGGGA
jgi:hypothetical protein